MPNWNYEASIYLPDKHCLVYRDEDLGVQLQIMTKRRGIVNGKAKEYYFIDGDNHIYKSEGSLIHALEVRKAKSDRSSRHHQSYLRRLAYSLNMF